jgi:nucleoside-diphosphate-sugar epimerase
VARALIVGCGCRGRLLGTRLAEEGWAVRGTSRREEGLAAIEAAGIEAALAEPERPATLLELIADVAVVHWLLGSASGESEAVAAIHGPRLERFLEHLVETPVRRFVYEAAGSVDAAILERGASIVRSAGERWRIPVEILDDPAGRQTDISKLG